MDQKERNLDIPIYFIECYTRADYDSTRENLSRKGFTQRGTVSKNRDLTDLAIKNGVEIAELPHFNSSGNNPSQTEIDLFTKGYNQ